MKIITTKLTHRCFRCLVYQDIDNFSPSTPYECKPCASTFRKKYRSKQYTSITEKNRTYRERNRAFVYQYLWTHPCADCGESDIVVLEFDHLGDKEESICRLMTRSRSLTALSTEIAKCEVVCSNCHKKRTAMRGQWEKLTFCGDDSTSSKSTTKGGN